MNLIRKPPTKAIPFIVILAGHALLFFAFFAISNNTANILAWGFDGIPYLEKSKLSLFIYESVHTTHAYLGLLLGLLLVDLASVIFLIRGNLKEQYVSKIFWGIWGVGIVTFIVNNLTLMLVPDTSHLSKYLDMMITNIDPDGTLYDQDIDPFQQWLYTIPALAAFILLSSKSLSFKRKMQPIIQTLPLFAAPPVLTYYFTRHYTCYEDPEAYSFFLNLITPVLILAPVTAFIHFTRRFKFSNVDA